MQEPTLTPHEQDWLDREILRRLAELDSLFGLSQEERRSAENKLRRWGGRYLRFDRVDHCELGEFEREELNYDWDCILFS